MVELGNKIQGLSWSLHDQNWLFQGAKFEMGIQWKLQFVKAIFRTRCKISHTLKYIPTNNPLEDKLIDDHHLTQLM